MLRRSNVIKTHPEVQLFSPSCFRFLAGSRAIENDFSISRARILTF